MQYNYMLENICSIDMLTKAIVLVTSKPLYTFHISYYLVSNNPMTVLETASYYLTATL